MSCVQHRLLLPLSLTALPLANEVRWLLILQKRRPHRLLRWRSDYSTAAAISKSIKFYDFFLALG